MCLLTLVCPQKHKKYDLTALYFFFIFFSNITAKNYEHRLTYDEYIASQSSDINSKIRTVQSHTALIGREHAQ